MNNWTNVSCDTFVSTGAATNGVRYRPKACCAIRKEKPDEELIFYVHFGNTRTFVDIGDWRYLSPPMYLFAIAGRRYVIFR
jgi:hypothetical protein